MSLCIKFRSKVMGNRVRIELPFQKILSEALREGGEFADLFFEQTHSIVIICEEDRIEKVVSGLDMGIGLRILFDGRTIYSFTNQIAKEALFNLAKTISRAIKEETEGQRIDLTHRERSAISSHQILNPPSAIEKHPEGLSIGEKVSAVMR